MKNQRRKAEEAVVNNDDISAHVSADGTADEHGENDDEEREFQVMHADLARRITERLELRDLLALEPHEAREHRAAHKSRDAQEDRGKRDRQRAENADLVIQPLARGVIDAVVGDEAAVRREHAVERGHDRRVRRAGCDIHEHAVERAVELERVREFALVHPEDTEAPVVRQRVAGPRLEDVLRRKRDADDLQRLPRAVDERGDFITRLETVRVRESLADHDFIAAAEFGEPAAADEKGVQLLRAVVGDGDDRAVRGLREAGQIERHFSRDPRLDRRDARQSGEPRAQSIRRAFQIAENIGEAVIRVVGVARRFERKDEAAHHDHHRQPAGHDDADGEHLALHLADVAEEFEIERVHSAEWSPRRGAFTNTPSF